MFPPGDIYDATKPLITLPSAQSSCDNMFGEQYLFTSCTNKCLNSSCPLRNVLLHDSCPDYYADRVRISYFCSQIPIPRGKKMSMSMTSSCVIIVINVFHMTRYVTWLMTVGTVRMN